MVIKINSEADGGRGGNEIIVQNSTGAITVYSHTMPPAWISPGTQIGEGQGIGETDHGSGTANGPHLHYQYRPQYGKLWVDPMLHHLPEAKPYPSDANCDEPPKNKSAR